MRSGMPITMLSGLMSGELSTWMTRTKRKVVLCAILALLALTIWALAMVGAIAYLAPLFGLLQASLILAAALLAIALSIYAIVAFQERRRRKLAEQAQTRNALYASAAALALPAVMRSRPLMLLALAAGGLALVNHSLKDDAASHEDYSDAA